jgi:hypothetical protein
MAPEYIDQFLFDGSLYMNTLQYFRAYEEEDDQLRADCYEGLTASYDSRNVEMTLVKSGERIETVGKIDVFQPLADSINVYCMAMITDDDLVTPLKLDERFGKFGDKAVVIEGVGILHFMDRVKNAVERDLNLGSIYSSRIISNPVDYVNREHHHQELSAFNKFKEYSWQREYRIVLGREVGSGPIALNIGDISDIASVVDTKEIMNTVFTLEKNL